MDAHITQVIQESISAKQALLADDEIRQQIRQVIEACVKAFRHGGKVLFCGNGGSAADAQHLAAEFSGRFYRDREPLFAEALHVNTSYLTAVANDYSFEEVFARLVRAMGRKGDILIALSTSGNSPNILRAINDARQIGMTVIGMSGHHGGKMNGACDILIKVPSGNTPRIQECHMLIGHIVCELVEKEVFPG